MTVDYHLHTRHSDAVFSVEEVLCKAQRKNIQSLAITDHDTLAGIKWAKACLPAGMEYITGVEITCSEFSFEPQGRPLSIHLLGYGFDEADEALNRLLDERAQATERCYQKLLVELRDYGISLERAEIPISCGCVLQLCDVVNEIQRKFPLVEDDVLQMVNSYAKTLTMVNISIQEGIAAIHNAGGKAVWAHPFVCYHHFERILLSESTVSRVLGVLIREGVDGLEADYLGFSSGKQLWLKKAATANGLLCTAGSDFHGSPSRCKMGVERGNQPDEMHRLLSGLTGR